MFRKNLIELQAQVFIEYLISQDRLLHYTNWVSDFAKKSPVKDIYKLEDCHIEKYLSELGYKYQTHHVIDMAHEALKAFRHYYKARSYRPALANKQGIRYYDGMRPAKTERNRQLVMMRRSDPKKWSWKMLGSYFNVHFTTAKEIFEAHAHKFAEK